MSIQKIRNLEVESIVIEIKINDDEEINKGLSRISRIDDWENQTVKIPL